MFKQSSVAVSSRYLGRLGEHRSAHTTDRAILGEYYGSSLLGLPGLAWAPWGAQKCSRLQPETFWENTTDPFPPRSAWSAPRSPGVPRTAARAILGRILRIPSPSVRLASLSGSECLAFQTPTQNYFELDCVFSSQP